MCLYIYISIYLSIKYIYPSFLLAQGCLALSLSARRLAGTEGARGNPTHVAILFVRLMMLPGFAS